MSFAASGIPPGKDAQGDGANFVSMITHGDPIGQFCAEDAGSGLGTLSQFHGQDALPHYGHVLTVGDPANSTMLANAIQLCRDPDVLNKISGMAALIIAVAKYHLPVSQAHGLGVTLSPQAMVSPVMNWFAEKTGPVVDVAEHSLSDLLHHFASSNLESALPRSHVLPPHCHLPDSLAGDHADPFRDAKPRDQRWIEERYGWIKQTPGDGQAIRVNSGRAHSGRAHSDPARAS